MWCNIRKSFFAFAHSIGLSLKLCWEKYVGLQHAYNEFANYSILFTLCEWNVLLGFYDKTNGGLFDCDARVVKRAFKFVLYLKLMLIEVHIFFFLNL
jgi:hypothetical protein